MEKKCLSGDVNVRIGEVKKRVNYLLVLREAQRAYIEYKRIPPNPRLEGYDYTTLNNIISQRNFPYQ